MPYTSRDRLRRKVRQILIEAGTAGIAQTKLVDKCRTKIWKRQDIMDILGSWLAASYVDKYRVKMKHSKRPVIIWRATHLLLNVY